MKDCPTLRPLLSAYVDGELDAERSRAVRRHLVRCADCATEEQAFVRLGLAARALPVELPADDLAERVRGGTRRSWRTAGALAAAALLVGMVGLIAYTEGVRRGKAEERERLVSTPGRQAVSPSEERAPDGDLAEGGGLRVADPSQVLPLTDHLTPGARFASLPTDHEAVRASRTVFADLELLDAVPAELHQPMLASQLAYFDLDRWARADAPDRPAPVQEVAALVLQLSDGLGAGVDPTRIHAVRQASLRPDLWSDAQSACSMRPVATARPDLDALLAACAADLPGGTRSSLRQWVSFKDDWVHSNQDPGELVGLIDTLPAILGDPAAGHQAAFLLPDLDDLWDHVEWTTDPDGTRRGELHVEEHTEHGSRSISVSIRRR